MQLLEIGDLFHTPSGFLKIRGADHHQIAGVFQRVLDIAAQIVAGGQLGLIPEQMQLFLFPRRQNALGRRIGFKQLLQPLGDGLIR